MQSVNLNKCSIDMTESKVSQDIAKCDNIDYKVVILQQQMAKLNEIIVNLEDTIQMKDSQLQNKCQEKNRLLMELKKQQRCNRNLKQQLDDERFFYQKEKNYFIEEMQRYRIRHTGNMSKFQQQQCTKLEQARVSLEAENKQFKEELTDKSEIIYNLCIKFLRMKHAKDTLRYKLDQLLHEHLLIMAEMMEKLDEARKELNLIVSQKFQESLPLNKAKFLQVVQRNNRLIYENSTLKVQIYQLTQNIEQLKSQTQRTKKINIDARIIEKLTMQNSTKSVLDKNKKITLFSKLSQSEEHFRNTNMILKAHSKNSDNFTIDNVQDIKNNPEESERVQSAPSIIE